MPFNEKGEFIRATPARPSLSGAAAQPKREVSRSAGKQSSSIWWVLRALAALAAVVGIVWVLWAFREWLLVALGFWISARLQQMFR